MEEIKKILSKLIGSDYYDFKLASELAGLNVLKTKGYTWHHLDDFDPITNYSLN